MCCFATKMVPSSRRSRIVYKIVQRRYRGRNCYSRSNVNFASLYRNFEYVVGSHYTIPRFLRKKIGDIRYTIRKCGFSEVNGGVYHVFLKMPLRDRPNRLLGKAVIKCRTKTLIAHDDDDSDPEAVCHELKVLSVVPHRKLPRV